MAEAGNSCRTWKSILSKNVQRTCERDCHEPLNGPCPDYKIINVVNQAQPGVGVEPDKVGFQPNAVVIQEPCVVKAILEPEPPVRRLIDTKTPCSIPNSHYFKPDKCCKLCDAQNDDSHINNFCSAECRPLSTTLHLQEYTKRPRPKPTYKHSILLKPDLFVGRVFPMKFRIRRVKNHCFDCGKELYFRDPRTDNENVIVLDNCCDVKVYTNRFLENWHRVPILSITGQQVMKKKTINEVCKLEPKKNPPVVEEKKSTSIIPHPIEPPKKGKGKGKGKKKGKK